MNPNTEKVNIGTIGELLVQLRLLEFGVQAAAPLKDSGNDLIAVHGTELMAIQVKTSREPTYNKPGRGKKYHILAVVKLKEDVQGKRSVRYLLDQSRIFLVPKPEVYKALCVIDKLDRKYELNHGCVDRLIQGEGSPASNSDEALPQMPLCPLAGAS